MNNNDLLYFNQKLQWNRYWLSHDTTENYIVHNKLAEDFLYLIQIQAAEPVEIICDLGCGSGQDSIFFAKNGLIVKSIDFSDSAIRILERKAQELSLSSILTFNINIKDGLPFENSSCNGIYSHLGLHYFDKISLIKIFDDIYRILSPGGFLMFNVKSDKDPSYGLGEMLEPNIYSHNGHIRHFFNLKLVEELLINWELICLEEYEVSLDIHRIYYGCFIKVIAIKK